jgi:hypothetical protein
MKKFVVLGLVAGLMMASPVMAKTVRAPMPVNEVPVATTVVNSTGNFIVDTTGHAVRVTNGIVQSSVAFVVNLVKAPFEILGAPKGPVAR